MSNKSKRKGYVFEKEIQDLSREYDPGAERARGSDGRSLGMDSDVDLVIFNMPWQAKRRANIANYIKPPDSCVGTIIREDYGDALAVVDLEWLLRVLERVKDV